MLLPEMVHNSCIQVKGVIINLECMFVDFRLSAAPFPFHTLCLCDTTRHQFFNVHAFCAITLVTYHDHISSDPLSVPSLTVDRVTNSAVEYRVQHNVANPLITGYEVTRFGVPMIGQYVNTGRGRKGTISPAVPGAQYRIITWALHGDDGKRSATPAVEYATTGEASECGKHGVH